MLPRAPVITRSRVGKRRCHGPTCLPLNCAHALTSTWDPRGRAPTGPLSSLDVRNARRENAGADRCADHPRCLPRRIIAPVIYPFPLLLIHASALPQNNETVTARAVPTGREIPPPCFYDNGAIEVRVASLCTPSRSLRVVRGFGWHDWDTGDRQLLAVVKAPPRIRTSPWTTRLCQQFPVRNPRPNPLSYPQHVASVNLSLVPLNRRIGLPVEILAVVGHLGDLVGGGRWDVDG
jgi:hypothetical protein